jgi:hypothetical protein
MKKIIYYADNMSLGETSDTDCDSFRNWAFAELKAEFPSHEITVSADAHTETVWTDDVKNETEIVDFCSRLWDRCDIW